MKFLKYLLPATLSLLIATNVGSQDLNLDLKGKAKGKISSFKEAKINAYTQQFTDSIIMLSVNCCVYAFILASLNDEILPLAFPLRSRLRSWEPTLVAINKLKVAGNKYFKNFIFIYFPCMFFSYICL